MKQAQDIKTFLNRIKNLIIDSKSEWQQIEKEDKGSKDLLKQFIYPLVILCGTISFLTNIFETGIFTSFCFVITTSATIFAGIYCSVLLLKEIMSKTDVNANMCEKIIIYSSSVFFIFHTLAYLFEEGSPLRAILELSQFLFIIPAWHGLGKIVKTNNRVVYAILILLILTIVPSLFEKLFSIVLNVPLATI